MRKYIVMGAGATDIITGILSYFLLDLKIPISQYDVHIGVFFIISGFVTVLIGALLKS